MTEAEISKKLMSKAGRILSRRAHSRGELRRKLSRYADVPLIEPVLDRLEELKLLNDADYAYNFAFCRMKQDGWGPLKVLHSLRRREIAPDLAEDVIRRIRKDAGDSELLQEYLRQYTRKAGFPRDQKGLQKLVAHLRRRGFHEETIFTVLRQTKRTASWQLFETGE